MHIALFYNQNISKDYINYYKCLFKLLIIGSQIEINDTLKISKDRGFPIGLNLENHVRHPAISSKFLGKEFEFWNDDERLYLRPPVRVFLVEEMPNGEWLYWSHALIISQT